MFEAVVITSELVESVAGETEPVAEEKRDLSVLYVATILALIPFILAVRDYSRKVFKL